MPISLRCGVAGVDTDDIDRLLAHGALARFRRDEALKRCDVTIQAALTRDGMVDAHADLEAKGDRALAGALMTTCIRRGPKDEVAAFEAARREAQEFQGEWQWVQTELAMKDERAVAEVRAKYQRYVDGADANGGGAQTNV